MTTALLVILSCLCLRTIVESFLNRLNSGHVAKLRGGVPEGLRGISDEKSWERTVDYTLAKSRLGLLEDWYEALILAVAVIWFLPWAYGKWAGLPEAGLWREAVAVVGTLVLLQLPELPFDWFRQFRLEERFGFNKSTLGLWVTDKVKGAVLGFVLMFALIGVLLWIHKKLSLIFPETWWLWGFGAFFVFQLLLFALWPMFILPLFNKLEPLEEGELKERLMTLADRAGFRAKTIEVMDGSKRSGHSNAFFTGFGSFRRIVLYDTLIEQMEPEELEAVLAHEIGHYKRGHVPKRLALSALLGLVGFWLIDHLTQSEWFYEHLGFATAQDRLGPVFLVLSLASGVFTFWLAPLGSILSRKHEYEADAFARDTVGGPDPLISSLRKLHVENLSNPLPHPLFAVVYLSHPTLPERERALRA
ncbi:MAG: M48 family metallopeptidase [Opitutales bacterium]